MSRAWMIDIIVVSFPPERSPEVAKAAPTLSPIFFRTGTNVSKTSFSSAAMEPK